MKLPAGFVCLIVGAINMMYVFKTFVTDGVIPQSSFFTREFKSADEAMEHARFTAKNFSLNSAVPCRAYCNFMLDDGRVYNVSAYCGRVTTAYTSDKYRRAGKED